MPDGHVLEFSGVTKRFGNVSAVTDFTARVEPGAVTGFLGPNGAGKTTTMRILLGLVRASEGRATIGGELYRDLKDPLGTVGSVLEAASFHPGRTAAAHLRIFAQAASLPVSRVDDALATVGLSAVADRKVGGFSLGMRQRLGLAFALLGDPGVLVLDEPVNGLDPEGIIWMRQLLRQLADQGRTVLVSSHLLAEVQQIADRLLIISNGRLVFQGAADELSEGLESSVVVDAPDRAGLIAALTAAGVPFENLRAGLAVPGADTTQIGRIALDAGVALSNLQRRGPSLEDVFLDLVSGVRVHPSAMPGAGVGVGVAGGVAGAGGAAGVAGADKVDVADAADAAAVAGGTDAADTAADVDAPQTHETPMTDGETSDAETSGAPMVDAEPADVAMTEAETAEAPVTDAAMTDAATAAAGAGTAVAAGEIIAESQHDDADVDHEDPGVEAAEAEDVPAEHPDADAEHTDADTETAEHADAEEAAGVGEADGATWDAESDVWGRAFDDAVATDVAAGLEALASAPPGAAASVGFAVASTGVIDIVPPDDADESPSGDADAHQPADAAESHDENRSDGDAADGDMTDGDVTDDGGAETSALPSDDAPEAAQSFAVASTGVIDIIPGSEEHAGDANEEDQR